MADNPWTLLPALILLAAACNPDAGEGDEPPTPAGRDDETGLQVQCSSQAPQITAFTALADGLETFEQQEYPVIMLTIDASDSDGDLGQVYYELWWDDHVDGVVDTSDSAQHDRYTTINSERCVTTSASVSIHLAVDGWLETNTWYDFAARVQDYAGMESGLAYTTGGTPKSDGSDPDPMD